jgi:hypothetical protein
MKKLRDLMFKRQKGDEVFMGVFLIIGGGLGIAGYIRENFLYYIRAGIFCIAALFLLWRRNK